MASITALQTTIESLPTIPETLTRVLRLADDPSAGAAQLAAVIRTDAPLCANLLRLANSVYYRRSREVVTVADAVALLGFRAVQQVAIAASVVATFGREAKRRGAALEYREIWRHGIATAAVARHLAPAAGVRDRELAFTGGLLHDLGKFVLNLHARREYDEVIARAPEFWPRAGGGRTPGLWLRPHGGWRGHGRRLAFPGRPGRLLRRSSRATAQPRVAGAHRPG